jgi:uncharacterized protein (DUF58 family)
MVIRTGDPFSLFESVATVGPGASLLVYPRVAVLPAWSLPPAVLEGASSRARHGAQTAPLATSVRPYTPSDAFNRIHWRSSARHQELQVKEFDIEPSADVWIFLDLDRSRHAGSGAAGSIETAIEVAAALAAHALDEGRGVGFEAIGVQRAIVNVDRGTRQRHKIMGLLAVAQATGATPLAEMLLEGASRLRRGTIAIAVTPSLDPAWVPPLATMRGTGVAPIACLIEAGVEAPAPEQASRAMGHVLAEHDIHALFVQPGIPLGEQLMAGRAGSGLAA